MKTHANLWTLAAAVAVLSLSMPILADDNANQAKDNNKDAQDNSAMKAKEDAMVVAHALGMAMDGCALQSMDDELRNAGNAEVHLRKHARSAFESSDRLMQFAASQVGSGRDNPKNGGAEPVVDAKAASNESPKELSRRFYVAASTYADTLRRMSTAAENANRPNEPAAGNANGINRQQENVATVTVINHGLCEVINAWKLRTEAEKSGNSGAKSESCQKLTEHAQQMDREGREVLATFTQANREEKKDANGRPEMAPQIQTLLRQANEILVSLDGLSKTNNNAGDNNR